MSIGFFSYHYGMKPNFQRAALGTIASGPRYNELKIRYTNGH